MELLDAMTGPRTRSALEQSVPVADDDEIAALRAIVEGTARNTVRYFSSRWSGILPGGRRELLPSSPSLPVSTTRVRTLAFWGRRASSAKRRV